MSKATNNKLAFSDFYNTVLLKYVPWEDLSSQELELYNLATKWIIQHLVSYQTLVLSSMEGEILDTLSRAEFPLTTDEILIRLPSNIPRKTLLGHLQKMVIKQLVHYTKEKMDGESVALFIVSPYYSKNKTAYTVVKDKKKEDACE